MLKEKNKQTILLVDDESIILAMFKSMFELEGFICITAKEASAALKLAKEIQPDIILSDLMMPVMNGFDFKKILSKEKDLNNIPFVFLTSSSTKENILKGFNMTIVDYILKTIGHKIIVEKVKGILRVVEKEKEKNVKKLKDAANETSQSLFPKVPINFEKYKISQLNLPYRDIPGGDFIDYIKLDSNRTLIVLGDVMGKEWGAWFFTFAYINYIRSAFHNEVRYSKKINLAKIMIKVNETLLKDEKISEIFATVSIILIDGNSGILKYSGAGDLPMILRKGKNGNIIKYISNGINLGLLKDGGYNEITIKIEKDDVLFIYTDGIIETVNCETQQFGFKRFIEIIEKNGNKNDFIEILHGILKEYSNSNFDDDISLISIRCNK